MVRKINRIIQIGNLVKETLKFSNPQTGRVYSIDGICPTLNTCGGGQREPKILIEVNNNDSFNRRITKTSSSKI